MKKLMTLILAVSMVVGITGTAMAANTVELDSASNRSLRVYWGPVFGTDTSGASAYVATGAITADSPFTGVSLYAISNDKTNTAGTEMLAQELSGGNWWVSGTTPIGGPQLISGTTTTVILYVASKTGVGNTANSGNTLYAINGGTGATIFETGLPANNWLAIGNSTISVFDGANTGASPYSIAPVTIDAESISTAGATIYGITSASTFGIAGNAGAGVSIWAINAQTGAIAVNGTTTFATGGGSGVSVIHTAPVISGNSIFVVGYSSQGGGGNTLYQLNKLNLFNGVATSALVNLDADLSDQWVPTPAVSGNSIFVVDNNGAVTAFSTANLTPYYSVDYAAATDSGVTAGPVTDGTYILLSSTSSVSCYTLNKLSTNVPEWTYNFGPNTIYTIDATPAISNGYVWITVNNQPLGTSAAYRFTLNSTETDGDIQSVATGTLTYASPIVVGGNVWNVSYNPSVQKTLANGAAGYNYWPQFKFDAAKTGHNTQVVDDDDVTPEPDDDDSGCFISTIK